MLGLAALFPVLTGPMRTAGFAAIARDPLSRDHRRHRPGPRPGHRCPEVPT